MVEKKKQYYQGYWDMFDMITNQNFGKKRFWEQADGKFYDKKYCDYIEKEQALLRFLKEIESEWVEITY